MSSNNNNNNLNLGNNNNNLNNLLNNNSGNKSKNSNKNMSKNNSSSVTKNNVSNKLNNRKNNSNMSSKSKQNTVVRTNMNSNNNSTGGGFSMVSVFIIVVILVILYFAGKFVYDYYNNNKPNITYKHLVDGMVDGKNPFEIAPSQMPTGVAGAGYSLSFWIIVNDYKNYRYGQNKYILRRGSVKGNVNPEVYLHPYNNTLQINISNIFKKEDVEKSNNNLNNNKSEDKDSNPTTTTNLESTTTTVQAEESTFVNIPTDEDIREGFTTCNCGEVKTNKEIMCEVNNNVVTRQREPDYNDDMFSLIQGNVIDSSEITHNKEQDLVMEQFKDKETFSNHGENNNTQNDCECEEKEVVTDTDRKNLEENSSIIEIPDFPLQTPVHVVISLHNNQVLDVFINGKLNKVGSKHIAAPEMVLDELVLGPDGGFDGKIGNLFYVNNPLSSMEVRDLYHKGMNYTPGFFSKIPNYVYVILVLLVVFAVVYSMMM